MPPPAPPPASPADTARSRPPTTHRRARPAGPAPGQDPPLAWVLSAKTGPALQEQAARLRAFTTASPAASPADIAYSLATTRSLFSHRAAIIAAGRDDLLHGLDALAAGQPATNVVTGTALGTGKLAFLFTGQGSQHPGMGAGLHATYPAFATALDDACACLDPHLGQPLQDIMFAAAGTPQAALLDHTGYTQPALFALQTALFQLLASWGIRPDYLAGHSIGELSAACAAGVLSLPDAATLVAARARLMQALPPGGAMTAIAATETEIQATLDDYPGVSIAAINGPASTVISGDQDAVDAVTAHWHAEGRRTHPLTVSHAFHSAHMDPILADFAAIAGTLTYHPPQIPIISNLTGQPATPSQLTTPAYWAQHARHAVRFHDTITWLHNNATTAYLELGPDATLTAMATDCLAQPPENLTLTPALRKNHPEPQTLTTAAAGLHTHGIPVNWEALLTGPPAQRVDLPTYPFQHQHYWEDTALVSSAADLGQDPVTHSLLATVVDVADGDTMMFTGLLSLHTFPWLADHAITGTVLLPGTAFVELALEAASHLGFGQVEELTLQQPLVVPGHGGVQIQVAVGPADDTGGHPVTIYSRADEQAARLARGRAFLDPPRHRRPWCRRRHRSRVESSG